MRESEIHFQQNFTGNNLYEQMLTRDTDNDFDRSKIELIANLVLVCLRIIWHFFVLDSTHSQHIVLEGNIQNLSVRNINFER